jgi:hypothetical protein
MGLRERLGGELRWTLNLAVYGVGGVLLSLLVCSGWGYGRISGKDERISRYTKFEVGNGSRISFWRGKWCRDVALKVAFQVLFGIARVKDASVANHLEFLGVSCF